MRRVRWGREMRGSSRRLLHAVAGWVRRQPPKVKAFLGVVAGMAALVFLRYQKYTERSEGESDVPEAAQLCHQVQPAPVTNSSNSRRSGGQRTEARTLFDQIVIPQGNNGDEDSDQKRLAANSSSVERHADQWSAHEQSISGNGGTGEEEYGAADEAVGEDTSMASERDRTLGHCNGGTVGEEQQ